MSAAHDFTLTHRVIGLAIEVHRHLGPGLLESAYEECLCCELGQAGIAHARQVSLPLIYKTVQIDCMYRMDIVVEQDLVLEIAPITIRKRSRIQKEEGYPRWRARIVPFPVSVT
jgi:GxxExxY protein